MRINTKVLPGDEKKLIGYGGFTLATAKVAGQIYKSMLEEWQTPYFMRKPEKLAIVYKRNLPYYNGKRIDVKITEFLGLTNYLPMLTRLEETRNGKTSIQYDVPLEAPCNSLVLAKSKLDNYTDYAKMLQAKGSTKKHSPTVTT